MKKKGYGFYSVSSFFKNLKFNRKLWAFLLCLIISSLFWVLTNLSKEYTTILHFPVSYSSLPEDKIVSNKLPQSIDIELNTFGFNILWFKLRQKFTPVSIDASLVELKKMGNVQGQYFLATNSKQELIASQFGNQVKIYNIEPDTIYFFLVKKMTRKIPVKPILVLDFEKQYTLSDSVKVVPEFITVSGSKEDIDKLKVLETKELNLSNINSTLNKSVEIEIPETHGELEFSVKKVEITIPVEKFTEGRLQIPIEYINVPAGFKAKTFPDQIEVIYMVSLNNFEKVNPGMFRSQVNFKDALKDKKTKLKVELTKSPSMVSSARLSLDHVEYIIQK